MWGVPKGKGIGVFLLWSALPQEHASRQGRRTNVRSLQPQRIFKVTVAVFDCSLLVIDQEGNVLMGRL